MHPGLADAELVAEDVCGERVEFAIMYPLILHVDVAHQINVRRALRALGARVPGWRRLLLRYSFSQLREHGFEAMRMFWSSVREVRRGTNTAEYPIVRLWDRAPDLAAALLALEPWIPSARNVAVTAEAFRSIDALLADRTER